MDTKVARISAGSFGAIYTVSTHPDTALKVVHLSANNTDLHKEYRMMRYVYHKHLTKSFLFDIPTPYDCFVSPASLSSIQLLNAFKQSDIPHAGKASYAMSRIHEIPSEISEGLLRQLPNDLYEHCKGSRIAMCRLYFGKSITWKARVNLRNFPIDVNIYERLRQWHPKMPSAREIVAEMGKILGLMLAAGFDARDVEFVMSGPSHSSARGKMPAVDPGGVRFHVFDFNQMRELSFRQNVVQDDAAILVKAYRLNDPYFPRPGDEFWPAFKDGYMSEAGSAEALPVAQEFLRLLEEGA